MSASAAFHTNASASLAETAVSASASFTCTLDSSIGVDSCVFSVATTDDQSVVADWVVGATTPTSQVFTAPSGMGKGCRIKCVVNGGSYVDEHGRTVTGGELIKYALVYIAPRVLVYGETLEASSLTGWVGKVNAAIRPLVISPTALSGTVTDYTPTGWATARRVRIDPNGAARIIRSFGTSFDGDRKTIENIGIAVGETLTINHEDGTGTAAMRVLAANNGNVIVRCNGAVDIEYDLTKGRWRAIGI